jgi:hypothetical protein
MLAEAAEVRAWEEKVELQERAIRLADSLLAMSGTEGYRAFVEAVHDIKGANYAKLTSPTTRTDRDANQLIGACRAIDDILELMTSTANNRARLVAGRQWAQDHLDKLRNPQKQEFPQ